MRRYLVVANQTLGGQHLVDELEALVAEGPCRFHVLVPATPPQEQWVHTEGEAIAVAEDRLRRALVRFGEFDAEVSGEVGAERPLDAIRDAVRDDDYDGIVLSTLPAGVSRWLGMDLPRRVERTFDLPVTHVVAEAQRTG